MSRFVVSYLSAAAVFLALDFAWLSFASPNLYRPRLGGLLLDSPNLTIAALFYLLFVIAVVVLAVLPGLHAGSWLTTLGYAALLGAAAYGTYDITNLATIRGWSAVVSVVDIAWGMLVTATSAVASFLITRAFTAPA